MTTLGSDAAVKPSSAWAFLRNLLDIAAVTAFVFLAPDAIESNLPVDAPTARLISIFVTPLLAIGFVWIVLRAQGHGFSEIGLGRINNPAQVAMQGVAFAALLFAAALMVEAMGFERDLSSLRAEVEGKPLMLLAFVIYAFIGAGLYEEVLFRGFALNRIARMFGSGVLAWPLAAVLQGALFGAAHLYQGIYGVLFTGILSTVFGFVFLLNGRNLWPLVLAHGLYDASRFVFFYLMWSKL